MSNSYFQGTNADELSQRLVDVAEPIQAIPLAIALDVSDAPVASASLGTLPDEAQPISDLIAGRYRVLDVLGQGGVGITYRADDLQTGQTVALKSLSLQSMQDWKQLELFEREAQTLKQLDHPGIPKYLDYFHVDTAGDRTFYIVQQLAEGESLAELVNRGWRSTEAEVKAIAEQLLEILAYLHSLEPPVIHRDIKPQNIIRRADGRVYLVDFGAVQNTYYNTFMRGSTVVGTFGYMAPEQFRGQAVPATDFYGLAATLLFLLTWRSPADIPQDRLRLNFRSHVQIPDSFADWLEQMLEPDADDRFSSAKDALERLRDRRHVSRFRAIVPWRAMVGVGLAAVALTTTLNHYRWAVLQTLGFGAPGICNALMDGDIGAVKNYLNQGGNLLNDIDTSLQPDGDATHGLPLECALRNGRADVAKLMISRIAGVNGVDEYGLSPLHWAVVSKDLTQQLLVQGAEVNAINPESGSTPLHQALSLRYFIRVDPAGSIPEENVEYEQIVRLLIDHGADVNIADKYGKTPLMIAMESLWFSHSSSSSDKQETDRIIELLLNRGAEVNVIDQSGTTPLSIAINRKDIALVKLLLNNGADPNVSDQNETTPLSIAVSNGDIALVKLLLSKDADPNVKSGWLSGTSLHYTAWRGDLELIELLLQHGADANARNDEGKTLLQVLPNYSMCPATADGATTCTTPDRAAIAALLKRYGAVE